MNKYFTRDTYGISLQDRLVPVRAEETHFCRQRAPQARIFQTQKPETTEGTGKAMIHYGRTSNGRIASRNVLERLWAKSSGATDEECWEYDGKDKGPCGHKRIRLDDKSRMMIHRLAWEAFHAEPVPEGLQINHHCDNPSCFNPHHLYAGTHADNMQDKVDRHRFNPVFKINPEDRELIRRSTEKNRVLAERYGVTRERIGQIKQGK
jgi:hypothetical protein